MLCPDIMHCSFDHSLIVPASAELQTSYFFFFMVNDSFFVVNSVSLPFVDSFHSLHSRMVESG